MTVTRGSTDIEQHGAFIHDSDLLAEQMNRTRADLYTEVKTRLDGDSIAGLSKLRKHELAAMLADWATASRDNEREHATRSTPLAEDNSLPAEFLAKHGIGPASPDRVAGPLADFGRDFPNVERVLTEEPTAPVDISRHTALCDHGYTQHRLRGRVSGATYLVLGSGTFDGVTCLWLKIENEGTSSGGHPIPFTADSLRSDATQVEALCAHRYTSHDSCPNCDIEEADGPSVERLPALERQSWPEVRAHALTMIGGAVPGHGQATEAAMQAERNSVADDIGAFFTEHVRPRPDRAIEMIHRRTPTSEVESAPCVCAPSTCFGSECTRCSNRAAVTDVPTPCPASLPTDIIGTALADLVKNSDPVRRMGRVLAREIPNCASTCRDRCKGFSPCRLIGGEVANHSSAEYEQASHALLWTDDYAVKWPGGSVRYRHKCGRTFYPADYRTLGGLVRAMLAHNVLCGR